MEHQLASRPIVTEPILRLPLTNAEGGLQACSRGYRRCASERPSKPLGALWTRCRFGVGGSATCSVRPGRSPSFDWGLKMKARSSFFGLAFAGVAFCATTAAAQLGKPIEGRPVSGSDIAGKKICWDDGGFTMFEPNGQFTNNRGQHSQWLVTEPGVVKIGVSYRQYEILPDGGFYMHRFLARVGSITGHVEHWGKVCN